MGVDARVIWKVAARMLELGTSYKAFARGRFFQQTNNGHKLDLVVYPCDVEHSAKQGQRSVDGCVTPLIVLPLANKLANLIHGEGCYQRALTGGTVAEELV